MIFRFMLKTLVFIGASNGDQTRDHQGHNLVFSSIELNQPCTQIRGRKTFSECRQLYLRLAAQF